MELLSKITLEFAKSVTSVLFNWLKQNYNPDVIKHYDLEVSLSRHLQFVKNWCNDFLLDGMPQSRIISNIYIEPHVSLGSELTDKSSEENLLNYVELLRSGFNKVIYGHAGAGKTTLAKRICEHLLFEEPAVSNYYEFPIVIRLRDFYSSFNLTTQLFDILGIQLNFSHKINGKPLGSQPEIKEKLQTQILTTIFNKKRILIILDGFDELPEDARSKLRKDLSILTAQIEKSDFFITVRFGLTLGDLRRTKQYSIGPFDDNKVEEFCEKWFNNSKKCSSFLAELGDTPFSGMEIRPLTLTTLCILYEKYDKIPNPPKEIYRRIVNLYLEKWDEQRDIKRLSQYGAFGPDRKRDFISLISYEIAKQKQTTIFSHTDLIDAYNKIHMKFNLPSDQCEKVVKEIESHTALIIQCDFDSFQFYHKSIQEYLCAEVISRLPFPVDANFLLKMPNECAVATSLSSDPNLFFSFICFRLLKRPERYSVDWEKDNMILDDFIIPYLERVIAEHIYFTEDEILGFCFLQLNSLGLHDRHVPGVYTEKYRYDSYGGLLSRLSSTQVFSQSIRIALRNHKIKNKVNISTIIENNVESFQLQVEPLKYYAYLGDIPREYILDRQFDDYLFRN